MIRTPADEAEAAALLREATANRTPTVLRGGGTRTSGVADQEAQAITSTGLAGIVDYEPAELVMIVRAGTPMAQVERALDENGQRLIFEPMDHRALLGTVGEPTIGGAIAANVSGPRRFVAGAARDSLLGLRFVNAMGETVKAGGRVMKNVTGLDLPKLLAGSHGTLGLLTEVSVKVWPKVECERTLVLHGLAPQRAAHAMAAAMATSTEPTGAAHLPHGAPGLAGPATALRLEGFEKSVVLRLETLRTALSGFGEASTLDGAASAAVWRAVRDVAPLADGDRPVWKLSVPPMSGHAAAAELDGEAMFDWQGGLVWLRSGQDAGDIHRAAARHAGHATLVRGDGSPFHPLPEGVAALSRRIKAQFDPAGILPPPPGVSPSAGA